MTRSYRYVFNILGVAVFAAAVAFGFTPESKPARADEGGNPPPPTMTSTPCPTNTPDARGEGNPDHGVTC